MVAWQWNYDDKWQLKDNVLFYTTINKNRNRNNFFYLLLSIIFYFANGTLFCGTDGESI